MAGLTAAAAALLLTAAVAAPAVARREALGRLSSMGLSAEIGEVRVGIGEVRLSGIDARSEYGTFRIREADVLLDWRLRPKEVILRGVTADVSEVPRKRGGTEGGIKSPARRPDVRAEDVKVTWRGPAGPGSEIVVEGAGLSLRGGRILAAAKTARMEALGHRATAREIEYDSERWEEVRIREVELDVGRPADPGTSPAADPVGGAGRAGRAPDRIPKRIVVGKATVRASGLEATAEEAEASVRLEERRIEVSAVRAELTGKGSARKIRAAAVARGSSADVQVSAEELTTSYGRISSGEFLTKKVDASASISVDGRTVRVRKAEVRIGKAEAVLSGSWGPERLEAEIELERTKCQDLLESVPRELVKKLMPGTVMDGEFEARAVLEVDLPDRRDPKVGIRMKNGCRVRQVPEDLDVRKLRGPFWREVYAGDGVERKPVRGGPGTAGWVPVSLVSQYVPVAVQALEDPGFRAHRGFLVQALENSVVQNIREGRFARGGSTVTMQLAKNLWLMRDKTLSRKLQEAVLTMYLEQSMTKDEILEYYLNVVEFGPDVYGIGPASEHYFKKHPSELTLSQSLFLVSILPRPRASYFGADGKLAPSGRAFLRRVMKALTDRGIISKDEYERGIKEVPAFGVPSADPEGIGDPVPFEGGIDPREWE